MSNTLKLKYYDEHGRYVGCGEKELIKEDTSVYSVRKLMLYLANTNNLPGLERGINYMVIAELPSGESTMIIPRRLKVTEQWRLTA